MALGFYSLKRAAHLPLTAYRRWRRPIPEDHVRAMFELNYYQRSLYEFVAATMANPDILTEFDLDGDSVVIDAGAYVGAWSEKICQRYRCRVFAFEPSPDVQGSLRRRLDAHGAQVLPVGLGASDRTANLSVHGPGSSIYGIHDEAAVHEVSIRDAATVFEELEVDHIDLLKINIEGGEYELLERLGSTGWLARVDRVLIQFHEWHPKAHRRRRHARSALRRTHRELWSYPWVWELWARPPKERATVPT